MNIENSYWYFRDVIPKNICDDIIKFGLQQNNEKAIIGDAELNDKIRKSNVAWLDKKWIYNEIHPYILKANENAKWNYDLNCSEHCQFTIYDPGQYYDWHVDAWTLPYLPRNQKTGNNEKNAPFDDVVGLIRKVSVTVCLNDYTEYQGGELEIAMDGPPHLPKKIHDLRNIASKGTVIVFPSFVWHRVKSVTSGTRYSLVIWTDGKPYR